MSLVLFESTDERLRGLSIYDADPSWTLHPPSETASRITPRCDNGEGDGSWFILDPDRNLWGALLRRGDAPYNDCLPPSESLLLESFREQKNPKEILTAMKQRAESGFYNPFNALVGTFGGDTQLLKQSFTAKRFDVPPGVHWLEDEGEIDKPAHSNHQVLLDDFPSYEDRKLLAENRYGEGKVQLSGDDGPRQTRFALVFDWDREGLRLDFCSGYPPDSEWVSRRNNLPVG